jgi:hypothetical protein
MSSRSQDAKKNGATRKGAERSRSCNNATITNTHKRDGEHGNRQCCKGKCESSSFGSGANGTIHGWCLWLARQRLIAFGRWIIPTAGRHR